LIVPKLGRAARQGQILLVIIIVAPTQIARTLEPSPGGSAHEAGTAPVRIGETRIFLALQLLDGKGHFVIARTRIDIVKFPAAGRALFHHRDAGGAVNAIVQVGALLLLGGGRRGGERGQEFLEHGIVVVAVGW